MPVSYTRRWGLYIQERVARPGGRGHSRGHGVRTLQEEEVDEPDLEPMNHVQVLNQICEKYSRPHIVDIQMNGKPLAMEVDTGACMSLISEQTLKRYFPNSVLKPSSKWLSAYSGHPLTTLGKMEVAVSYQRLRETLPLLVVAGAGPSLLGSNWLTNIRLDWRSIGAIVQQPRLTQLLKKYGEVFSGGLGKLIGHKAKIHVDPTVQLQLCKVRTIQYALRSKVEAELKRLQQEGIIEPVTFADWATPIVPVLKADRVNQNLW